MRMASRFGGNIESMHTKENTKTALRIALGICFILSGLMKAVNVYSFAHEIRLYIEAYMDSFMLSWVVKIAVIVCTVETASGLLAFKKEYTTVMSVVFLGMMSFFVWLTGINLFCPLQVGSIESCGCFGELVHFSPLASFVKSVVLWGMTVGLFGLCMKTGRKMPLKTILMDGEIYMALAMGALPPVFSCLYLENMEHGYYLAGYLALCVVLLVSYVYCNVNGK